jgi:hypothetical protein
VKVKLVRLASSSPSNPIQPNDVERSFTLPANGRLAIDKLARGTYAIKFGQQYDHLQIDSDRVTGELIYDPAYVDGCPDCADQARRDPAKVQWLPAFAEYDNVISGPELRGPDLRAVPMPVGVLPGDVIEGIDDGGRTGKLAGAKHTRIQLRLFRPGTGERLTVPVQRTLPDSE